jgi:hypothetical protein
VSFISICIRSVCLSVCLSVSFLAHETSSLAVHEEEKRNQNHSGVSVTSMRGSLFLLLSVSTPLF